MLLHSRKRCFPIPYPARLSVPKATSMHNSARKDVWGRGDEDEYRGMEIRNKKGRYKARR